MGERRMPLIMGRRLVTDDTLVDWHEDWSQVRSPSRAARRRRYGHPQRIRRWSTPKPNFFMTQELIICHPEMAKELLSRTVRFGAFGDVP